MTLKRGILELATCTALLTSCGSEYQPYTTPLEPTTPPLEALLVRAGPNSTGTGIVAGSGIDCAISGATLANTCTASLSRGDVVTLTAAPTGGSSFLAWGDACVNSGSSATCTVTLSEALAVSASFAAPPPPPPPPTYTVTIRKAASGNGTGTVSGTGISCSITASSQTGDCSETFVQGTQLTLTAAATGGGSFAGWSGACAAAGTTATCALTVSQNTTVDASFAPPPPPPPARYVVTVAAASSGTGTGTVTASGITCTISAASQSGDCTEEREEDTQFTLTAAATGGSTFAGWSGACSGTSATCTITVSQATTVRASFTAPPPPPPPPPSLAGFWSGSDAGVNVHYHITLAQSGATLSLPSCVVGDCRLTALTPTGSGWLGASFKNIASLTGSASTTTVTFTMNLGDRSVTFEGALTTPTKMVGQVSGGTMAPQSLTLERQ